MASQIRSTTVLATPIRGARGGRHAYRPAKLQRRGRRHSLVLVTFRRTLLRVALTAAITVLLLWAMSSVANMAAAGLVLWALLAIAWRRELVAQRRATRLAALAAAQRMRGYLS